MNNQDTWKLISWLCVLLFICTVVFNSGNYSCLNLLARKPKAALVGRELADYRTVSRTVRTPAAVTAEMRAHGFLKNDFRQWFAAPQGKPDGAGTAESPFDLATALNGGRRGDGIKPGDLIWLRGGRYMGSFTATVAGEKDRPVHFRQYPGERAVLDKGETSREKAALTVRSANLWFWDFEIANSHPDRAALDAAKKLNPRRGSGVNVFAPDTKYINLVVRDNGHGFGVWNEAGGTEIYGCLIFNNGVNKKEHGIYAHNRDGTQVFADNLIFNNAGYGLHIYADSAKSSLRGFSVQGNTIFNNGALTGVEQVADQILVGGVDGAPAARISITENFVYCAPDAPTAKSRGVRLGYEDKNNADVKLADNLIVGKIPLKILWWRAAEISGNTIVAGEKPVVLESAPDFPAAAENYRWDGNRYLADGARSPVFEIDARKMSFDEWRRETKFDAAGGIFDDSKPLAPMISLRANRFDETRAALTVFNPPAARRIEFDPGRFLQRGDYFEIYDAQNFFAAPVASGNFQGGVVKLPLEQSGVTLPMGETEAPPVHTKADFAAFVIFRRAALSPKSGGE